MIFSNLQFLNIKSLFILQFRVIYHVTETEGCSVVIIEWKNGLHKMETCLNCQQIWKYFHFLHVTSPPISPFPRLSLAFPSPFPACHVNISRNYKKRLVDNIKNC